MLRHGSHSFTCKQHHACLSFVSVHQMAPPQLRQQTPNCSLLLIYRPRRDERLSWHGWLTYNRWYTHINGHPSATGRAHDCESSPAKDRCSTAFDTTALCITVAHNTAQNRLDNFPSYSPDNHNCSDDTYMREGETLTLNVSLH